MKTTANNIGATILQQLGGEGRLASMIGAKQFMSTVNGLQFKWAGKTRNKSNCAIITLDPSDTYTLQFHSVKGFDCEKIAEMRGLYADDLQRVFTEETGLYLSL